MGINLYRKSVHISFGIILLSLCSFLSYQVIQKTLLILVGLMVIFEVWRLFRYESVPLKRLWVPLLKKEEFYRVSDGWWYVLSLVIVSHLIGLSEFKLILLIFTFGDPVAALTGFYLGKHKIFGNKTLEGTMAFFLASLAAVFLWFRELTLETLGLIMLMSISEALFKKDNLFTPLTGASYFLVLHQIRG